MLISVPSFALCGRLSNVNIRLLQHSRNSSPQSYYCELCPHPHGITITFILIHAVLP